jgi:hypothetical protein
VTLESIPEDLNIRDILSRDQAFPGPVVTPSELASCEDFLQALRGIDHIIRKTDSRTTEGVSDGLVLEPAGFLQLVLVVEDRQCRLGTEADCLVEDVGPLHDQSECVGSIEGVVEGHPRRLGPLVELALRGRLVAIEIASRTHLTRGLRQGWCPEFFALLILAERRPAWAQAVTVSCVWSFSSSMLRYLFVDHSVPAT